MKKYLSLFLILCFICVFAAGCSDNDTPSTRDDSQTAQNDSKSADGVDVDLTVMSSTMVYAEVSNIMTSPKSYVGKTIKASGDYNVFYDEENDQYYHYFIIKDATGCCPQGLDFVWNGDHAYPNDYPEINTNIEVTGVYNSKEVLGQTYYYLAVDDITVLK